MIWISHVFYSSLLTLSILEYFNLSEIQKFFITLFSAFASILPDADIERRTGIRRIFYYIFFLPYILLKKTPKHRGVSHTFLFSLFPTIFLFLILYPFKAWIYSLAFFVGYNSHIILDAFSIEGVRPFLPFSEKRIRWKIRTGSIEENILIFSLTTVALLFHYFYLLKFFIWINLFIFILLLIKP